MAGLAIGLGVWLLCEPALWTLGIGQANGLVMLGFVVLGVNQRGRWRLAGVGIGVAAALKLSPVLVLVYVALREAARGAAGAGTVLALSAVSVVIGRPGHSVRLGQARLSQVSAGTLATGEPIGGGVVGVDADRIRRPVEPERSGPDPLSRFGDRGGRVVWRWWRMRRHAPLDPLELGVLILGGPSSWAVVADHYFVWAAIPLAMIDARYWPREPVAERGASVLTMGVGGAPVRGTCPCAERGGEDAADWSLRLTTTPTPSVGSCCSCARSRCST